jgi:glycosyltransferase involved in cell wall biosynthesis
VPGGRKRLLFVSNLFPDQAEPYRGLDNATVLHHLGDRWEVRVAALRPSLPWKGREHRARPEDDRFKPDYLRIRYVPKIGSRVNHLLMASSLRFYLEKLRKEFPFDAVLSSWIYPDSCAVARLSKALGFRFVSIAQGSDVHQYLRNPTRREVIRKWMPAASAIITRSRELARLLEDAGIAKESLHPVYNGVDQTLFRPINGTGKHPASVILFVGNFYPVKQPLILVEAFAKLVRQRKPNCELHLLGGGPMEAEIRSLSTRLGVSSQVRFLGRQDAAGVAASMQTANVLCLPSANEGVPNVILEAFSSGLPVVASDVGGISEVLNSPALGRLVPSGDTEALTAALAGILEQPPDREAILQHSRQYTWDRTAEAYHQLLVAASRE